MTDEQTIRAGAGPTAEAPDAAARGRRSLLWKYAAYSAALVGIVLVAVGVVAGSFTYRDSEAAQAALLREKAGAVAIRIASFVDGIEGQLAWTVESAARGADRAALRVEMLQLLRRLLPVTELRWIDAEGREQLFVSRIALDRAEGGADFAADPRFQAALGGKVHASPVHFRRETEPYLSLAVGSPQRRGGVLIAEVNLKFVWEVVSSERVGRNGLAYVIDSRGQLVSHPNISLVLARTDFSGLPHIRDALARAPAARAATRNLAGESVLAAGAPIERIGWTVFAELPTDEALAPVYAGVRRLALVGALGLLGALAASVFLARRMVRPIRALGEGADRIGAGRLDQRIHVGTGDELDALGTQFNRMAERLQESYATLESRIAERTEQLAAANQAKTQFLAAASHDLRQPMHALALTVGELRQAARAPDLAALAQRIDRSVDALEDLLDALLDISQLDAGAITPQPTAFPLQSVLGRLGDELGPAAEAKGLRLRIVPTALWTESDPTLLGRMLLNLVSNAVRYTRDGGVVVGCRRRGAHADIVVADSGIGIAEGERARIFEEFYQAGNPERNRAKGLGLGLAIVQRLSRLLDHPVGVRSQPGRGSAFGIRVPIVAPRAALQATTPTLEPGVELAGLRVLVVDDEPDVREALGGVLARWGCSVEVAGSGAEALAIDGAPPVLVLCDLRLRESESGLDVLDRLKGRWGASLQGVVVTAETAPERLEAVRARGYPVLHKPVRPARLRALAEQLVRERAAV